MRKLSIAEIVGKRFENDRCYANVTSFDPISEMFFFGGFDKEIRDPCTWTKNNLYEFDVEVVYTPEEKKMVEDSKLTKQIAVKAQELQGLINKWLNSGPIGRGQ